MALVVAVETLMPQRKETRTLTPKRQAVFLDELAKGNTVRASAAVAGGSARGYYDRRQQDPHFAAAWERAWDEGGDLLEAEAQRRAVEGVERPVTVAGEREVVREFSDTLLIFLLKARRPWRFRDNVSVEHAGGVTITLQSAFREANGGTDDPEPVPGVPETT